MQTKIDNVQEQAKKAHAAWAMIEAAQRAY
jgi:hypothetical protein